MKLTAAVSNAVSDIRTHWKYPAKNKYIPYRELAAYSFGGIGIQFVAAMAGLIIFNGTSALVGASIGIDVLDIQWLNVISTLLGFLITPMRAMVFDNTRSKMGKFRPYLLYMGFPTAVLSILMVYMPYGSMSYGGKFATLLIIYNLLQLCSPFYTVAYTSLVQVMSPNSEERNWVIGVSSFIFSLAPSITNFIIPLIGKVDDLSTYRKVLPFFCIAGVALGMLCVFGTKEKIIVSKQYEPRVHFFDGMKKIAKNKYFWIIYGSTWLPFFNVLAQTIFMWVFYWGTDNHQLYAVVNTLLGTAAVPGMLLGPVLINKFGARNVYLISNLIQVAACLLIPLCYGNLVIQFLMFYIKFLGSGISMVYLPSMKADALDYQQYKTGDRLEGFMEQSGGLIGTIVALGTGYLPPLVQHRFGLFDNYADLYNADFRNPLVTAMLVCTAVTLVISCIPVLFYDLSRSRHQNIIKVLKVRALFEDYANQELSEENLVDTIDAIREAEEILKMDASSLTKKQRPAYDGAQLVMQELHKFEEPAMLRRVEEARRLVSAGPQAMTQADPQILEHALALPESTQAEKEEKKQAVKYARSLQTAAAMLQRNYPNGVVEPSRQILIDAVDLPDSTKEEKRARRKAIRRAEDTLHMFEHSAAPYIEAKKLLRQYEAYQKRDEIFAKYEDAVTIVAAREQEAERKRALEAQEKLDAKQG